MVLTEIITENREREKGQYSFTFWIRAVTQVFLLTLSARLTLTIVSVNQQKSSEYCNSETKTKSENGRSCACSVDAVSP